MDDNHQHRRISYQSGFANQFASEALPGTLPQGRNSPQRVNHGLVAELISGTAFTAPRSHNLRTWVYRRLPSVVASAYHAYPHQFVRDGGERGSVAPEPLRWHPLPIPGERVDFVDGLRTIASGGAPDLHTGVAVHMYVANESMHERAFIDADGELLLVPQQGVITLTTELGVLEVAPGEFAVVPRGMAMKVDVAGPSRGYVCENHGAPFRLPELGPIGSNGLANPRDFLAPVAAFERHPDKYEVIKKFGGSLWKSRQPRTPFDVVAWHGNLVPYKYDTANFMAINSVSFDHCDPSIFTVLTSESDTPGVANCDFVIFPPRWSVAEDTFRPPWYHRNVMSEFMGLVRGQYDAKPEGFVPGGMSLHNAMVPHGPDMDAYDAATTASLKPVKLEGTLAFMFESRWLLKPTQFAMDCGQLDAKYADCWAPLADRNAERR